MAFKSFEFSIPKQTAQLNPYRKTVDIMRPVIGQINVEIPPGHKGLAVMNIYAPGYSFMEGVRGDDQSKNSGPLNVEILGPPYNVIFEGWNNDNFLPHTFVIEIQTR
jgi:hypothetical protein